MTPDFRGVSPAQSKPTQPYPPSRGGRASSGRAPRLREKRGSERALIYAGEPRELGGSAALRRSLIYGLGPGSPAGLCRLHGRGRPSRCRPAHRFSRSSCRTLGLLYLGRRAPVTRENSRGPENTLLNECKFSCLAGLRFGFAVIESF